jgi:hypothetical protein
MFCVASSKNPVTGRKNWRCDPQGAGFLSIPHAFVVSGMVSGPVLCIFFAFLCNITKDYALEALSRLEALTKVVELVC